LVVAPSAALRLLQHQFDLVIIFVNQASNQQKKWRSLDMEFDVKFVM
jgi:hypothetical protein